MSFKLSIFIQSCIIDMVHWKIILLLWWDIESSIFLGTMTLHASHFYSKKKFICNHIIHVLLQERTRTLLRRKNKSHTHTYMMVFWRAFPGASCFQNHQTNPHLLGLPKMSQKVTTDQQQSRSMCLAWKWFCLQLPNTFSCVLDLADGFNRHRC